MLAGVEALTGERLDPPGSGRIFSEPRTVALADVGPDGLVRFDALARFLQDVATSDVREVGVERAVAWVVRRTTIVVREPLRYGERVEVATWCSGTGRSLAERRTSMRGEAGGGVETVSLWVSLDRETLRPAVLEDRWFVHYRESAGARKVRSRFVVPLETDATTTPRPWPLRASDEDLMRHVNNAVSWAAVEEEAGRVAEGRALGWGQVEYRLPLDVGDAVAITSARDYDGLGVWLWAGREVATAARVGWENPLSAERKRHSRSC